MMQALVDSFHCVPSAGKPLAPPLLGGTGIGALCPSPAVTSGRSRVFGETIIFVMFAGAVGM